LFQNSLQRTSQASYAPFFCQKPKLRKRNKHEFWVKLGGFGAFVVENSTASFFVPKVAITALPGEFCDVVPSKTETPKTQQTLVLVKWGGLGAFVAEISTASFFVPKVAITALQGEFYDVVPSKTETLKTQQTLVLGQMG